MNKIIQRFLIICLFPIFISGCETLDRSIFGIKNFAENSFKKIKKTSQNKRAKIKVPREEGYLSKGAIKMKAEINEENDDSETDSEINIIKMEEIQNASKWDLIKFINEMDSKLKDEKTKNCDLNDELKKIKTEYHKQIFDLENQLEKEKQNNQELKDLSLKSEFEAINAKQKLNDIKTSIIARNNAFQSTYPVFYEVVKGDSLWKIASRKKIYNNPYKWLDIYYANKDKISDQDEIYPGVTLIIPRYFEVMMSGFDNESTLKDVKNNEVLNPIKVKEK